ncbi:hypothetical protein ACPEH7_10995 [Stenotrophomonas sp. NPDC101269]|uniref:hypothetical protein n=1 Tax=Stenotrophomonas TaxID=40323 RepID=UPI0012929FF3|nr:hypothetical protein [Stenotrophomonas nematodicola]
MLLRIFDEYASIPTHEDKIDGRKFRELRRFHPAITLSRQFIHLPDIKWEPTQNGSVTGNAGLKFGLSVPILCITALRIRRAFR